MSLPPRNPPEAPPPGSPDNTGFSRRAKGVLLLFILAGLVLYGRVVTLQVIQRDSLAALAQRQYQRTLQLKGRRGDIVDRTGRGMAISIKAESFFANPRQVVDPALTAFRLSRALGVDRTDLEAQLRSDRQFVWIMRQTLPQEAGVIKKLRLPGIHSLMEYRRAYPGRFSAAGVMGFTGVDIQGLEGLEYAYDSYLRGENMLRVIDKDALGRTVLFAEDSLPAGGGTIQLTLHPVIQMVAETSLRQAVEDNQALRGVAVVLDSRTAEILALAQWPGFNANDYQSYDKETYFNRAVTSGYEPGSTFKIITFASALEEGVAQPDSLMFCENGEFHHHDSVIHDTSPHGWLPLSQVLAVSSNICTAKIAALLPRGVQYEYIRRFGLGQRVGLFVNQGGQVLGGEASGHVPLPETWTPVDSAAISFGHGVLVSPLQMVAAVNVIATGGVLMRPFLVSEIRDHQGRVVETAGPTTVRTVISRQTAKLVRDFMVGVVESPEGTGRKAAMAGYRVAGKTGTTEKYEFEAQGYSKTRQIASFAGFVPAENPRITMLVVVEEPQVYRYGGDVAAPVFKQIAQRALPLLGVWPAQGPQRWVLRKKSHPPEDKSPGG